MRIVTPCLILALCGLTLQPASAADERRSSADAESRARELVARMTLEEKVGQTVQYSSSESMTGPGSAAMLTPLVERGQVGSLLNVTGARDTLRWQKLAVESSRLRIPLLFGLDVIHGYRTIFPVPLGSAASWDLEAIERAERIAATEAAAAGIRWTFAPMVDIARDPRWGRIMESAGEDPYLGSRIAEARVRGFQSGNLASDEAILACAKHFAAYGAAQAGRDYYTTDVTERTLRDVYLPPFKAAVDAGVGTLMAAFNDLDGTPCSANRPLLEGVLRREWGFGGFVVSDWAGIEEMRLHGNVENLREAALKSFVAGVDMDMQNQAYGPHLVSLVREGLVSEARLNEAVTAIIAAKYRLGLFDDPYRYSDEEREKRTLLRPEFLEAARDIARRSCVLLKNDGTLPLASGSLRIALVGPLADAPQHQIGSWQAKGVASDAVTLRTAFAERYPGAQLRYAKGCELTGDDTSGLAAAVEAARQSDVVVVAVGEGADQSGEATSRAKLDLSGPQLDLLRALHGTGKPLVVVLMSGRPLLLETVEPWASAILAAWHPGTMGGPAIADVLTGAYNPAGRLPVSWPRSVGQIPLFYSHKNSGRPLPHADNPGDRYYSHYIDSPSTPLYPFGFGLSYTQFRIDTLALENKGLSKDSGEVRVSVRVTNEGSRAGETVVQLYVRDRVGSVTRPVRELKGFSKVSLAAGEARTVEFSLKPTDLAFWRADNTWGTEPGLFDVFVGEDSNASLTASFSLR